MRLSVDRSACPATSRDNAQWLHGDFKAAGQRLAKLVACHQQALARASAGRMEVTLLRIRLVVFEPILS
jgi:hypothetical protein